MADQTTREMVERAARLAGVELTSPELELFRGQLGQLLAHMARLGRLTDQALHEGAEADGACPLREDEPAGSPLAAAIMERAPRVQDGFFSVPRPQPEDAGE